MSRVRRRDLRPSTFADKLSPIAITTMTDRDLAEVLEWAERSGLDSLARRARQERDRRARPT